MSIWFILALMIFLHIIDDYVLQAPCLSSLKQKSFWEKNAPDEQYAYDYIVALIMHAFSWSFMIMLPVLFWGRWEWPILIANMCTHAVIDDAKANKFQINLIQDQTYHLIQIIATWLVFVVI